MEGKAVVSTSVGTYRNLFRKEHGKPFSRNVIVITFSDKKSQCDHLLYIFHSYEQL